MTPTEVKISTLQDMQKRCRPDSAEWQRISAMLKPLFAEMAAKTVDYGESVNDIGGNDPDYWDRRS